MVPEQVNVLLTFSTTQVQDFHNSFIATLMPIFSIVTANQPRWLSAMLFWSDFIFFGIHPTQLF